MLRTTLSHPQLLKFSPGVPKTWGLEPTTGATAGDNMLDKPLTDAQGNKLTVVRTMPGAGASITLTSSDQQVVRFNADAQALKALSVALATAAEVADRAARA